MCAIFHFFHQKKTSKKLSKMLFILPKKLFLALRFSNLCTSLSPFFSFHGLCWFYWRSWLSLWHHNVLKLDFKNADSLISVELNFWCWYFDIVIDTVLNRTSFHEKIWLSQGRLRYTTLSGKKPCLLDLNHCILSYINQRSTRALEWGWVQKLGQAYN